MFPAQVGCVLACISGPRLCLPTVGSGVAWGELAPPTYAGIPGEDETEDVVEVAAIRGHQPWQRRGVEVPFAGLGVVEPSDGAVRNEIVQVEEVDVGGEAGRPLPEESEKSASTARTSVRGLALLPT